MCGVPTLFEGGGLRQPAQEGLPLLQDLRAAPAPQKPFFSLEPEKLGAITEGAIEALPPGGAFKQTEAPKPPPGVFIRPGSGSVKELAVRTIVQSVVDETTKPNINEAEKKILAVPTGTGIGDLLPEEQDAALQTLAELRLHRLVVLGEGPE